MLFQFLYSWWAPSVKRAECWILYHAWLLPRLIRCLEAQVQTETDLRRLQCGGRKGWSRVDFWILPGMGLFVLSVLSERELSYCSCFRAGLSPGFFAYTVRLRPPLRKRSVKSTKWIQEGLQGKWLSWRIWHMIRLGLETLSWFWQLSDIKSAGSHESWHSGLRLAV